MKSPVSAFTFSMAFFSCSVIMISWFETPDILNISKFPVFSESIVILVALFHSASTQLSSNCKQSIRGGMANQYLSESPSFFLRVGNSS